MHAMTLLLLSFQTSTLFTGQTPDLSNEWRRRDVIGKVEDRLSDVDGWANGLYQRMDQGGLDLRGWGAYNLNKLFSPSDR